MQIQKLNTQLPHTAGILKGLRSVVSGHTTHQQRQTKIEIKRLVSTRA